MSVKIHVNNKSYIIPISKIPNKSIIFYMMKDTASNQGELYFNDLSVYKMDVIYDYLVNGKIPQCDDVDIIDYFDLSLTDSYEMSLLREKYIKKHINKADHPINSIDNYALTPIDMKFWADFKIKKLHMKKD